MAEPAAKRAKTEDVKDEDMKEEDVKEEEVVEHEKDEKAASAKDSIKEDVVFHTQDTTMNVMASAVGNMLMPLSDGGLQYLLAGARANVGVKSGRYAFEVKLVEVMAPAEDPAARTRTPQPRTVCRVGFAAQGSSLFLGETEDSICFDMEGACIHNKTKSAVSEKFSTEAFLTVVLNLDANSPNAHTVSLFKGGARVSQPQALPENLKGKALFPAVSFKNCTVHCNFGPVPLAPLPFKCKMVGNMSSKDAIVQPTPVAPKDGKYEVLFPVCLPDEGTFDWLDLFLEKNPQYTEISDRSILHWAEMSGLTRPKGFAIRTSNDKPEMGFEIGAMNDGSIRRVLQAVAPVQNRHFVVMEVKSNLVKADRMELLSKWSLPSHKKIASIMIGTPPKDFTRRSQELALKAKQEALNAEHKAKVAEEKRKKMLELRQKKLEKEKQKALKRQKKQQEELRRRLEIEKKKKEAAAKGEEYKEEEDEEMKPKEEEEEEEEEEVKEEPEMETEAPKAELTPEEKSQSFRKLPFPDLTQYQLNTSFSKFSIPEKDEGFDDVKFEWANAGRCKEYVKLWIQERKTTTRIEDINPGEWFTATWKEWQKNLQQWHAKQNSFKAMLAKKAADKAAAAQKKAMLQAAKDKAAAEKKVAAEKKAAERARQIAAGESVAEEEPAEPEPEEKEEPVEEEEEDDGRIDFDNLDVFGVEDVTDIGGGEPLFVNFAFEDWTMMSLRFELHLLAHAFSKDVKDPDRIGIHVEHMSFYYNKYFKKALNHKYYGAETIQELLELIKDTVMISKRGKVVEPQLPEDMESMGIFVMLTEEMRRDRSRRVDLGDESARLKLTQPTVAAGQGIAVPGVRPTLPAGIRPGVATPGMATMAPRPAQAWSALPKQGGYAPPMGAGVRPTMGMPMGQVRGYQPQWRPQGGMAWRG